MAEEQTITRAPTAPVLPVDAQDEIVIRAFERGSIMNSLLTRVENTGAREGTFEAIRITQEDPLGERVDLSAYTLMGTLAIHAPDSLIRNLRSNFTFGVFVSGKRNPVLVLKTNQFDAAFAGMLDWEENMNKDLAPLFGPEVSPQKDFFGTPNAPRFSDVVVNGYDSRALVLDTGEEVLLYTFPDEQTIVITTSREALASILERI